MRTKVPFGISGDFIDVELHYNNREYYLEILDEKYCRTGKFIIISEDYAHSIINQYEEEQIENNHFKYIKHT